MLIKLKRADLEEWFYEILYSTTTLIIMTFSIITLSLSKLSTITFSVMKLSIMTFSITINKTLHPA